MGGHETVNHRIYRLEEREIPPGFLLLAQYTFGRISKSSRLELAREARKAELSIWFDPEDMLGEDDPSLSPILFFAPKSDTSPNLQCFNNAKRLTGKFFPGVVTIVPINKEDKEN